MHFHAKSPYLCEAFHIMATSPAPRAHSTDWGSVLYFKLWRRLVVSGLPPFKILPWCFSDGRSCRLDNRLPDPFAPDHKGGWWRRRRGKDQFDSGGRWGKAKSLTMRNGGDLDMTLRKVFAVHLHNQWAKTFPRGGWIDRLLLKRYDTTLRVMERQGQSPEEDKLAN